MLPSLKKISIDLVQGKNSNSRYISGPLLRFFFPVTKFAYSENRKKLLAFNFLEAGKGASKISGI